MARNRVTSDKNEELTDTIYKMTLVVDFSQTQDLFLSGKSGVSNRRV